MSGATCSLRYCGSVEKRNSIHRASSTSLRASVKEGYLGSERHIIKEKKVARQLE